MRFFFEVWGIVAVAGMASLGCVAVAAFFTDNGFWGLVPLPLILWIELRAIARIPDGEGRAA